MSENTIYINEIWLSNQLAWLLNSKGTHGLRERFASEFFQKVIKKIPLEENLNFINFEVLREFYIQVDDSPRRIDIVYMDLSQNTVIVIENKHDGKNSKNQLSEYMEIEKIFRGCKVYYVYLTYEKDNKINLRNLNEDKKDEVLKVYNDISWQKEIFEVLQEFTYKSYEVYKLYILLSKDSEIEFDFTEDELKKLSVIILNKIDALYLDNPSKWEISSGLKTHITTKNKHQNIFIYIRDKNIEYKFGKNKDDRVYNIQNILSNKQILYYMIYILFEATKVERSTAYKSKEIDFDKNKFFDDLYKELKDKNENEIIDKLSII